MGDVIELKCGAGATSREGKGPQMTAAKQDVKPLKSDAITRRRALGMMLAGLSFRTAAKLHPGHEEGLVRDIRAGWRTAA